MIGVLIYGALLVGLGAWTLKRPSAALGAVMVMYGLEQWGQTTSPFLVQHGMLTNVAIGLLVVLACLLSMMRGRRLFAKYPPEAWIVLAFLTYTCLSSQWAPREDLSTELVVAALPYFATIVVAAPLLVVSQPDYENGLWSFLVMGAILSTLILAMGAWGSRGLIVGDDAQTNPLAIAQMAGGVAIVALLTHVSDDKWWRIGRWLIVIVCIAVIVRTSSRGQLFAMLVAATCCWPVSWRVRNLSAFVGWSVAIVALCLTANWTIEYFLSGQSRWEAGNAISDLSGRIGRGIDLLEHWWNASLFNMVFGLGNSASYDPRILGFYSHVVPLEILAEEGLVGMGMAVAIAVMLVRRVRKTYRAIRHDRAMRGILGTLMALTLMSVLLSLKQGSVLGSMEMFAYIVLLARFCAYAQHAVPGAGKAAGDRMKLFQQEDNAQNTMGILARSGTITRVREWRQ